MVPFRTQKSIYYITRAVGVYIPESFFRSYREKHSNYMRASDPRVAERVNYYNKLGGVVDLGSDPADLRQLLKDRKSTYFYDFYEFARYFSRDHKFRYIFGDVRDVPPLPAFVKSRPIAGDNANSILLKLNKIRHFNFIRDPYRLDQKKDVLVWRGKGRLDTRKSFVEQFSGKDGFDVGQIEFDPQHPHHTKSYLSVRKQLASKFIFSLEGIDVASNLKWIMSSNSICVMKKPRFETWFMEGKLIPGVHYIGVHDDFSNLEEKLEYYRSHPAETNEILSNAHHFVDQFRDPSLERQISLLVIQRYFERTAFR